MISVYQGGNRENDRIRYRQLIPMGRQDKVKMRIICGDGKRGADRRKRLFFQADDGIRGVAVTGVQTCALPISPGDDQSDTFTGVWHLYVAATYDGGATWNTVDATPNDPVQRGCIWLSGGSNPCRNLLDF